MTRANDDECVIGASCAAWRRVALGLLFSVGASADASADPYSQFSYCAPPVRPVCVDRAAGGADSCHESIQAFVASVFTYRNCLEREIERAVREANDVIESGACRANKARCRPNTKALPGHSFAK